MDEFRVGSDVLDEGKEEMRVIPKLMESAAR